MLAGWLLFSDWRTEIFDRGVIEADTLVSWYGRRGWYRTWLAIPLISIQMKPASAYDTEAIKCL